MATPVARIFRGSRNYRANGTCGTDGTSGIADREAGSPNRLVSLPVPDHDQKRLEAYERFGVPSYWLVDPDSVQPELTIFELRNGRYALAVKASGPFAVDRPVHLSIDPADLTRGLRP